MESESIEQPAATQEAESPDPNNLSTKPEGEMVKGAPLSPLIKFSEAIAPVRDFLTNWGNDLFSFWTNPDNQKLLFNLLLLAVAFVSLYILLAMVDAINHVPLLPSLLKLMGMGYSVWFGWRYVVLAKNRQELMVKFEEMKTQIRASQSPEGERE
jgi:hypothetical protein